MFAGGHAARRGPSLARAAHIDSLTRGDEHRCGTIFAGEGDAGGGIGIADHDGARLSHLFVRVHSLAETRRFYVELLGLEVLMEEPGYLRIGNPDGWHMGMEEGRQGCVFAQK